MSQKPRLPSNAAAITAVIVLVVIIGGVITIYYLYPAENKTSFNIAFSAIVLLPILILAALAINSGRLVKQ
ncbi:MAG TPA: hypothetical protein VLV31_03795 [Candidatus Acidoferrales bacterium]|nr:hypothetical protein [Candidatus Acidoferrales bacterium]